MTKEFFVQEDFCPVCVAAPLAIAAGSASVAGSKKKKGKPQQLMRDSGIALIFSALGLFVFYRYVADCKECAAKM